MCKPILAKDATDEAKSAEISQLLQDYPTGNSIVEIRIMEMQGYILGTTNQTQQSIVGTRSTEADVQQSGCLKYCVQFNYIDETLDIKYCFNN